jgi:hypothetical protein
MLTAAAPVFGRADCPALDVAGFTLPQATRANITIVRDQLE